MSYFPVPEEPGFSNRRSRVFNPSFPRHKTGLGPEAKFRNLLWLKRSNSRHKFSKATEMLTEKFALQKQFVLFFLVVEFQQLYFR